MQSGRCNRCPPFWLASLPQGGNTSESAHHQQSHSRSRLDDAKDCCLAQSPGIPQDVSQHLAEPSEGTSQARPDVRAAKQAEYRKIGSHTRHYTESSRNCSRSWASAEDSRPAESGSIGSILKERSGGLPVKALLAPALIVVDLDSGFDAETLIAALQAPGESEMEEEALRIRYFEAMDMSLDRRFSDVIQLQSEEDLDSDDDDHYERLITPGTLVEPNAWPMRIQPTDFSIDGTSGESSRPSSGSDLCSLQPPIHPVRAAVVKQAQNSTASGACVPSSLRRTSTRDLSCKSQDFNPERVHIASMDISGFRQESRMRSEFPLDDDLLPFGSLSITSASGILSKSLTCQMSTSGKATVRTPGIIKKRGIDG